MFKHVHVQKKGNFPGSLSKIVSQLIMLTASSLNCKEPLTFIHVKHMAVHSLEWTKKHYKGSPKLQFIPTQTLIKGSKQTCNQKLVSAICCVARTCFCTKMVFVPFLLTMMRVADAASPRKDLLEMKRFGLGIDQALVHDYTLHRSQTPPSS